MHTSNVGLPRALSFDLWGTLIGSNREFKALRNENLRREFAPHVAAADFDRQLRAADREADDLAIASGQDWGFVPRLQLALRQLEAPIAPEADLLEAERQQRDLALQYHPVPIHPEIPQLLVELSEFVPLAITSNTGMLAGSLMRELLECAKVLAPFSVHVFSNELGVCKPSPQIFSVTHRLLRGSVPDLHASDITHVGDNPIADVFGAESAGFRAVLVNVPPSGTEKAVAVHTWMRETLHRYQSGGHNGHVS